MRFCPSECITRVCVAACLAALSNLASAADLEIHLSTNTLTEVRGWGLMPAPFDRQLPTYADGSPAHGDAGWLPSSGAEPNAIHRAVCSLGFNIARVYLPPSLGKSDGSLDEARLQDLKDHLTILAQGGVTNYVINMWTPPAHMKIPDRVRFGKYQGRVQRLDAAFADDNGQGLSDYICRVLRRLRDASLPVPVGISIQNEPDVAQLYDGCMYADTPEGQILYRRVAKQLRRKLDQAGFSAVPILATESSGAANVEAFLGVATINGFERLRADPALASSIGGFAWHQYYTVDHVRTFRTAMAAHHLPLWMTEVAQDATPMRGEEIPATEDEGLKVTINMLRRMAADFTDFRVNYWFFWRGWHSTGGRSYPAQDLVYGDEKSARLTKLGLVLQRLWTTVRPGWRVLAARSSNSEFRVDNEAVIGGYEPNGNMMSRGTDLIAFADPASSRQLVVLVNRWNEPRTIARLDGFAGAHAQVFVTTRGQDLEAQPERPVDGNRLGGGPLLLPPMSVVLIIVR
jgi:hypothetical protein